jgi:hypothetical protein
MILSEENNGTPRREYCFFEKPRQNKPKTLICLSESHQKLFMGEFLFLVFLRKKGEDI